MRFDEKQLGGPEELLEQERQENQLVEEDEERVPEIRIEDVLEEERENLLMLAMREILEHRHIVINDLKLPKRELMALEALKAAVSGKTGDLSQFVFASDRRDLLEQALVVLQPKVMHDVTKPFQDLVQRVGLLRHDLRDLEDAQDELLEANQKVGVAKTDTDTADKPKPTPKPSGSDQIDDDVSLNGPERTIQKPPTSLTGERKPEEPFASTLDGPPLKQDPPPEISLGSKEDLAAADIPEPQRLKTKPFWRGRG